MLDNIFYPLSDWGPLILRLATGAIFLAHGRPKLKPGGPAGFAGFLKQIGVPFPTFFAWVVILLETVGAVLLIIGLGTRLLAIGFAIDMLVAIVLVKRKMMNAGFVDQKGGWEFEFALLAQAVALVFTGSGSLALDRVLGF